MGAMGRGCEKIAVYVGLAADTSRAAAKPQASSVRETIVSNKRNGKDR